MWSWFSKKTSRAGVEVELKHLERRRQGEHLCRDTMWAKGQSWMLRYLKKLAKRAPDCLAGGTG